MPWRISKIEIENLKFFHGVFSMNVDRKNILLFGENGAGKSSIYWSVYTHFQAFFKSREQAAKYFISGHPENLRNRYAESADVAGVTVSFKDENNSEVTLRDTLADNYNDTEEFRRFMRASVMTSDFLNYKQISKLFDFENSRDNDVFKIFEKEVFPLLDMSAILQDINGKSMDTSNIEKWWNYLKDYDEYLPRNAKKKNSYLKGDEYKAYLKLLKIFNSSFNLLMGMIIAKANEILNDDLHIPVKLVYKYEDADFHSMISVEGKKVEALTAPRILIHAKMTGAALKDVSVVQHPKSFFNEAKITCMGIALRLSVLMQRNPVDSAASVIFFDDLLISLDMSMRMEIVPKILNFAEKWQLFVFTHDRSLFHLYKSKIESKRKNIRLENEQLTLEGRPVKEYFEWQYYELYSKLSEEGIPKWVMAKTPSYLELAKIHLQTLRIPECANALRRYCEQQVKRIAPVSRQYKTIADRNKRNKKDLNALLNDIKSFLLDECKILALQEFLSDIDMQRKLMFNPFSHDDVDTPFYREELKRYIKHLPILEEIEKIQIYDDNKIRKAIFKIELGNATPDDGNETYVKFMFLERFYKVDFRGKSYFNDPSVRVLEIVGKNIKSHKIKNSVVALREVYGKLHKCMNLETDRYGSDIISEVPAEI